MTSSCPLGPSLACSAVGQCSMNSKTWIVGLSYAHTHTGPKCNKTLTLPQRLRRDDNQHRHKEVGRAWGRGYNGDAQRICSNISNFSDLFLSVSSSCHDLYISVPKSKIHIIETCWRHIFPTSAFPQNKCCNLWEITESPDEFNWLH